MVEWCETNHKPVPKHTLYPRTKGFVATVKKLRESKHVKAVYDMTIAYAKGRNFMVAPSQWETMYRPRLSDKYSFHVHVERYPLDELPQSDEDLASWLEARWLEKSETLEQLKQQLEKSGTWRQ